jgi:hypothetical protein
MPNCTVCKCPGHNRRTCTYLKEHFLRIITEEIEVEDVNSPVYGAIKDHIYAINNSDLEEAINCEESAEVIFIACNYIKSRFQPRHPGLSILDRFVTIRENVRRRFQEDEEFIFDFVVPDVVMPTTPSATLITPSATPMDTPYPIHINDEISPIIDTPSSPQEFVTDYLPFSRTLFTEELSEEVQEEEQEEEQRQLELSFDADYIPFSQEELPDDSFEFVPAPRRYKRGHEYAKEIKVDLRNVSDEDLFGEVKE